VTGFSERFTQWVTREPSEVFRYFSAIAIAIAAIAMTALLKHLGVGGWLYIADVLGVILGALVGRGYGPALLNSTLIALGLCFFFIQPGRVLSTPSSVGNLILFLLLSGAVSWIISLLREAVKLERISANSKDQVISVVSHDLKDPMGATVLNAQLLEKTLLGQETVPVSKVLKYSESILRSGEQMDQIVQDLLAGVHAGTDSRIKGTSPSRKVFTNFRE